MSSPKRIKWNKKKARRLILKKQKIIKRKEMRREKRKEMNLAAKTIKLRAIDGVYPDNLGYRPEDVVKNINKASKCGLGWPVCEQVGFNYYTRKVIGYYLKAEVTDIGEIWARYFEIDSK